MITAVTSFNPEGWKEYAGEYIETWIQNWPGRLIAYCNGERPAGLHQGIEARNFFDQPEYLEFVAQLGGYKIFSGEGFGKYDYHHDILKFSRKVFAITHAALSMKEGIVYWIDADIKMGKPIPEQFLMSQAEGVYTAHLGRKDYPHSEGGVTTYDTGHRGNKRFMKALRRMFVDLTVLTLPMWHDAAAYDWLLENLVPKISSRNLTLGVGGQQVFSRSPFGEYMEHRKGTRKDKGRPHND